jgi:hypothetical protein
VLRPESYEIILRRFWNSVWHFLRREVRKNSLKNIILLILQRLDRGEVSPWPEFLRKPVFWLLNNINQYFGKWLNFLFWEENSFVVTGFHHDRAKERVKNCGVQILRISPGPGAFFEIVTWVRGLNLRRWPRRRAGSPERAISSDPRIFILLSLHRPI